MNRLAYNSLRSVAQPQIVAEPRSCYRCGSEFHTDSKQRVCPQCRKPRSTTRGRPKGNGELSPRERQVIALVLQAKFNKEIAWELRLSEGTVKQYLNRIFMKLRVKSRIELAIWAMTREQQTREQQTPPVVCIDHIDSAA